MINYSELNRYYTGTIAPITFNAGGVYLELGEDINTLLYKLGDNRYVDVNRGVVCIVDSVVPGPTDGYVVFINSLTRVEGKDEIKKNTNKLKRLFFKPSRYTQG